MRYIYLILLAILFSGTRAQTLTQSFNEPVVGDIDTHYRLDTSAYATGLPTGITGTNCVWNYSLLSGVFPVVVDSFLAPSAAPNASANPGATFVQHRSNPVVYTFYKSGNQQTELLGGYSPTLTLTFTNTAIIASYPVSYGYSSSDDVGGTFKYNNSSNGAGIGSISVTANGLGTLNFANNISIHNVLCLKSVEIVTLSAGILPFGTFNQTIYNYYMPGKKFPVLNITYSTYQFLAGTPTITAFVYGSNDYFTVAGIHEQSQTDENYRAFPNPFSDHLSINAADAVGENEYTFYDVRGKEILKTRSLEDERPEQLDAGVYFLEIKTRQGRIHQKVIKQ